MAEQTGTVGDDILNGSEGSDIIRGGDGNDSIFGHGGADFLYGEAGDDVLKGGAGNDQLYGGAGNDIYDISGVAYAFEDQNGGIDKVRYSGISYGLTANVEILYGVSHSGQELTGNALDNLIVAGDGDDILAGQGGVDRMEGNGGNDTYHVENSRDRAVETAGEGEFDAVRSSVSYSIAGQYIEILELTGTAALNGTGNGLHNELYGNAGNNKLRGGGGNDILVGNGGTDLLYGGTGDDIYVVDNVEAKVIEWADQGTDFVEASVSYSLAGQHVENLSLTGDRAIDATGNGLNNDLTGNAGDNKLRGGAGNDLLYGSAGVDTLYGEEGNDLYVIDDEYDEAFEEADQGTDTVESSISYSLAGQYIERLVLTGSDGTAATGNSLNNELIGNEGSNRLRGYDGDDLLSGGHGNDILVGGEGADTFRYHEAAAAEGIDTISDFTSADDVIMVDGEAFGFAEFLSEGAFVIGSEAQDADDRIVYDSATGEVFFDADGAGGAQQVLFLHLEPATILTAGDFYGAFGG